MTWLQDAEPFELKETITRKRIQQGLTPARKKKKDTATRKVKWYSHHYGLPRHRYSKLHRKGNGIQEWGGDRDAFARPDVQGKSSRVRMRLIDHWWQEAVDEPCR